MSPQALHSVSVAGAIVDAQGRFLAIRRADNGRWEPPGGVLETDEEIEAGVRREVYEETGVRVEVGPLTGVYKNVRRAIVALVFRCSLEGGSPEGENPGSGNPGDGNLAQTAEAAEVAWLHADQVRERMSEAYACRLLDAVADGPPSVRTHDGASLL